MNRSEHAAGQDQLIVVFIPDDFGVELDPEKVYAEIAADAAGREADGWRIATISTMPLRHAGTMFGNDGSGYQTKAGVAVVYARGRGPA